MGAVFPDAHDGIDQDRFDAWCEHVMVRELNTGRVVGTYRLLTPEKARDAGGYYSESEFDLAGLGAVRDQLVEAGRSCTHPDFRNGAVIMLLWSGVAEVMRRGGYDYLLGCASVSLRDDGVTAAEVWRAVSGHLGDATLPRVAAAAPLSAGKAQQHQAAGARATADQGLPEAGRQDLRRARLGPRLQCRRLSGLAGHELHGRTVSPAFRPDVVPSEAVQGDKPRGYARPPEFPELQQLERKTDLAPFRFLGAQGEIAQRVLGQPVVLHAYDDGIAAHGHR